MNLEELCMRENILDIFKLKESAHSIKEFGLGFIQVKMSETELYNFYTDKVHMFKNATAPHNHEFGFTSRILLGVLVETLYNVEVNDCGESAFCGCGDTDKVIAEKYVYSVDRVLVHSVGEQYIRHKRKFHSVIAEPNTVTHLIKLPTLNPIDAIVIADKVDYVSSDLSEGELWGIVEDIINISSQSLGMK